MDLNVDRDDFDTFSLYLSDPNNNFILKEGF